MASRNIQKGICRGNLFIMKLISQLKMREKEKGNLKNMRKRGAN